MNINKMLKEHINSDYKKFHEKLCHTKYEILGVKIPILRKIAKELLNQYNYSEIFNNLNDRYYEHNMLEGLIIANTQIEYAKKLELINYFLPKIDNWAICDIFVGELKFIKNNKELFLDYLNSLLNVNKPYYKRFVIVVLLTYYIDDYNISYVLNTVLNIKDEDYYIKMACAWCISICLIKHFDTTIEFLNTNKNKIDKWTYNKALQKGIESFRISDNNKNILRSMKI